MLTQNENQEISVQCFRSLPKQPLHKWGVLTVRERNYWKWLSLIEAKAKEAHPILAAIFNDCYVHKRDQTVFHRFLNQLFQGKIGHSREVAHFFDRVLHNQRPKFDECSLTRAKEWLSKFFEAEPEMAEMLSHWVCKTMEKTRGKS